VSVRLLNINITDGQKHYHLAADEGEILLDVLRKNNILIPASCNGKGTCEKCNVTVSGSGMVLACQYPVKQDIEVLLPGFKDYAILDQLNPHARHMPDESGLQMKKLPAGTVITYKDRTISVLAHDKNPNPVSFGLAVDIGTTTIVLYLMDLNRYQIIDVMPVLNPQTAYGADVISRIEYCISHRQGLQTLQQILIDQLNRTIGKACQSASIKPGDIHLMTCVGNTIMLHLLLGVDPRSIGIAPFTPVFTEEKMLPAEQLSLNINPAGILQILPSIAGYVGADIVAGVAATDLTDYETFTLYIDIGTNGEIVLGNRDILYCCSTAAGPAFEGARIKCGVGGVEGGIAAYEQGHYKTIGDKAPIGICGSGLIDLIAYLLDKSAIDCSGKMANEYLIEERRSSGVDHDIVLTQKDVREVQLAKSAIYAGILTLIDIAGIRPDQIGRVYLAGGFGNYIRIASAVRIGLLPAGLEDRILPVGNSAGTGALLALKSLAFEREIDKVKKRSRYIELSLRPDFNEAYLTAMHFPEFD